MSVSENLIANESIVTEAKKHWIAPVRDSLWAAGMILLGLFLWYWNPSGDGILGFLWAAIGIARWVLLIGGIAWIVYNIVVWRTAEFAVTNLRVLRYEGFMQRRSSETLLTSVSDVKLNVGIVGKSLGYGDLQIFTQSGDAGADSFSSITKPAEFRNAMMTVKLQDQVASRPAPAAGARTRSPGARRARSRPARPGGRNRGRPGREPRQAGGAPGPGCHLARGVRGEEDGDSRPDVGHRAPRHRAPGVRPPAQRSGGGRCPSRLHPAPSGAPVRSADIAPGPRLLASAAGALAERDSAWIGAYVWGPDRRTARCPIGPFAPDPPRARSADQRAYRFRPPPFDRFEPASPGFAVLSSDAASSGSSATSSARAARSASRASSDTVG